MLQKIIFVMVLVLQLASLYAEDVQDELIQAVKNNNVRLVRNLINEVSEINILIDFSILDFYEGMEHSTKGTLLMWASYNGHFNIATLVIRKDADIDTVDKNGWTALMYASYDHIEVVKYLLDNGSDLVIEGDNGWDALYVAAVSGNYEIVKLLLERGAPLNKKYKCVNCGQNVLIVAAERGYADIAKLLIQKGCEVNMKDDWGYTALDWAERKKHEEIATLLKKAGAKKGKEIE